MPVPVNLTRAEMLYTLPNGAQAVNVFHVVCVDATLPAQLQDIAETFQQFWTGGAPFTTNGFKKHFSTTTTLTAVRVTGFLVVPPTQVTHSVGVANTSGSPSPNEGAFVVTWTTASIGQRRRGRSFFPAPQEATVDTNGRIATTSLTDAQDDCEALIASLSSAGHELVVWSRLGDFVTAVTGAIPRSIVHHQSRRNA